MEVWESVSQEWDLMVLLMDNLGMLLQGRISTRSY